MKIENENASDFERFKISQDEFDNFRIKNRHKLMNPNKMICENNNIMQGSYLMVNPKGKFFDNTKGSYTVSEKITRVGFSAALRQIEYDYSKFIIRDGDYYINSKIRKAV